MRISYLFASLLLTGCAGFNSYKVNVDSLAANDALNYRTYVLLPATDIAPGLEFEKYAEQIDLALQTKGLDRVFNADQAQAVVIFGYMVGKGTTSSYTTSVPQYGQTGYSSSQTYGTVSGNQYSSNTYYTPRYGITGYQQIHNTLTTYPLGFYLTAFAKQGYGTSSSRQLWQVSVTATSQTPDLRSAFPYMLYGAQPYLGFDSGGNKEVMVPHNVFATPK